MVIRSRVLAAISHRALAVARQPRAVVPVKLGRDVVPERVVTQVSLFMMAYSALVVGGFMLVTLLGGDTESTIAGVIGSLGNMGPAYGDAGPTATFQDAFPTPARMVLAFLMLVGRLESMKGVRRAEADLGLDVIAEAHDRYRRERDAELEEAGVQPEHRPTGGVGGTRVGVKCLHAHYGWWLAGGDDPVGQWVADHLHEVDHANWPAPPDEES